jgi:hypothetical protein
MRLLKRLFGVRRKTSQAHVLRRTADVIDTVIYDMGIDTLVAGTFVLDKSFRLSFSGVPMARRRGIIASIQVSTIAEAELFLEFAQAVAPDSAIMKANGACLAHAIVRELGAQSAAFRALPASEA